MLEPPIHIERGTRHVSETYESGVCRNRMAYCGIQPGVGVEYQTTCLAAGLRPPSLTFSFFDRSQFWVLTFSEIYEFAE